MLEINTLKNCSGLNGLSIGQYGLSIMLMFHNVIKNVPAVGLFET